MVPPVLMTATLGMLGFCGGGEGATKVGLVPAPVFSILVAGVI